MEQMALDLWGRVDPTTCQYREPYSIDGVSVCRAHDVFVRCTKSICGEPPRCTFEPLDNSPEAVSRRVEWMRTHRPRQAGGGDE